jgi:hypothetical protein
MNTSIINLARKHYHKQLLNSILTVNQSGVPSNADVSSKLSVGIASGIVNLLEQVSVEEKVVGQTSGKAYEVVNTEFLEDTFPKFGAIRPGEWIIRRIGNRDKNGIAEFAQYTHLQELNELAKNSNVLATALGQGYIITPDTIIARIPLSDDELNNPDVIVDENVSLKTMIRKSNSGEPILHASISSKWTIRSDRSQNSRTEALNLIRNRKGPLPHIVVVTAEPLPSRIASIAMGTGDIDCVYHSMLYELVKTIHKIGAEDSIELIETMINGNRLKDISDLPLDLAT